MPAPWRACVRRLLCSGLVLGAAACGGEEAEPSPTQGFGSIGSLSEPDGKGSFRFGAASAATQIEDQNTQTDWYLFTQPTADGGLGKGKGFLGNASKGFEKAVSDVQLLSALALDSYRFSIEWARIEPQRDQIDEAALKHYSDFIDALVAAGIRPVVTLHHFSNPVWVDDPRDPDCAAGPTDANLCGLGHPQGGAEVVAEMEEHATLIAQRFGDRVDEWGTVNEPINYLLAAYGIGSFPPGKSYLLSLQDKFIPVVRDYASAHAKMYHAIKAADTVDADADGQAASVGMSLSAGEWVPARANEISDHPDDVAGRDRLVYVFHFLWVDAMQSGRFDPDLDGTLDEDQPNWKGTLDWLGVQYYFRAGVTSVNGLVPVLQVTPCFSTFNFGACLPPKDPTFCVPAMGYEYWAPGLFSVLKSYSDRYPELPLVVSESGIATEVGERRAENVVRSLQQIQRAQRAGVDVRGYYHWSLYDNFEWAEGYEPRFGLYHVDYNTYERSPTLGADVLGEIVKERRIPQALGKRFGGEGPMTPEGTPGEFCGGG